MDAWTVQRDMAAAENVITPAIRDFDESAIEEMILRAFHKHEAHATSAGMVAFRVVQLEVDTAQAGFIEDD